MSQFHLGISPDNGGCPRGGMARCGYSRPSLIAWAQDQSAATTKDVIFARKIMMDSIGNNMDEIDTMLQSGRIDLIEGREHADMVSVMLMAFPAHRTRSNNSVRSTKSA